MPQIFVRVDQFGFPVTIEACYKCTGRAPGNYLCTKHFIVEIGRGWPDIAENLPEADRQGSLADCVTGWKE